MIVVKIQNRNKHKWMRTGGTHILGNPHIYTKSDVARGWKFFTLSRIHIYYMIYIYLYIFMHTNLYIYIYLSSKKKCFRIVSSQPHEFPTVTHDSSRFDIVAARLHPSWALWRPAVRKTVPGSRKLRALNGGWTGKRKRSNLRNMIFGRKTILSQVSKR